MIVRSLRWRQNLLGAISCAGFANCLYEALCIHLSILLRLVPLDVQQVQCTAINHIHKRVVKFDLLLPPAASDVTATNAATADATFVPVANKGFLPENLRDSARFHSNQMPVLLQRLLKSLYAPRAASAGNAPATTVGSSS